MTARCKCCASQQRSAPRQSTTTRLLLWQQRLHIGLRRMSSSRKALTIYDTGLRAKPVTSTSRRSDTEFCDEQPAVAKLTAIAIEGALCPAASHPPSFASEATRLRFYAEILEGEIVQDKPVRDLHSAIAEIIGAEVGVPAEQL